MSGTNRVKTTSAGHSARLFAAIITNYYYVRLVILSFLDFLSVPVGCYFGKEPLQHSSLAYCKFPLDFLRRKHHLESDASFKWDKLGVEDDFLFATKADKSGNEDFAIDTENFNY